MPRHPKRRPQHVSKGERMHLTKHVRHATDQLRSASPRSTHPSRDAEHVTLTHALARRADDWRTHEIRLPRGVKLVPMLDEHDRPVYAIDWGRDPPPAPPTPRQDRAMAVETVWTVFMHHRPWAIDDECLRALVERPPVPPAQLLSELLSLCFFDWLRRSFSAMAQACIDAPTKRSIGKFGRTFGSFVGLLDLYETRAKRSLHALYELLDDVAEPNASMHHELARWRHMLLDYTRALDGPLYEHVHGFVDRFGPLEHCGVHDTWYRVLDCRRLDACLGLLLARATMLDPSRHPTRVRGYVDPMATRAVGSFAWWCQLTIDAWEEENDDEDEHEEPLGDRLCEDRIATFVRSALLDLEGLVPGLREELLRLFPLITE